MSGCVCPICGDPHGYPIWIDPEPPAGCPHDAVWHRGGAVTIRNITECKWQLAKARQAAEFRKLLPDAFDENGVMKSGRLGDVLRAFHEAWPDRELTI